MYAYEPQQRVATEQNSQGIDKMTLTHLADFADKNPKLRTFARVLENSFIYETTIAPLFAAWESALTPLLPRQFARYDISLSMEKWQENIRPQSRHKW